MPQAIDQTRRTRKISGACCTSSITTTLKFQYAMSEFHGPGADLIKAGTRLDYVMVKATLRNPLLDRARQELFDRYAIAADEQSALRLECFGKRGHAA